MMADMTVSPASDPILRVTDLRKCYPVREGLFSRGARQVAAVDGVSFAIAAGETLGLVGESGCGKTTTGRCIVRLVEPSGGSVRFEGRELLALPPSELRSTRRHIQMIFQDPYGSLNPRMTAGSIVEEPLIIHRAGTRRERREQVATLLALVGLDGSAAGRYPHEFSGGQRQRIGIARALALHPKMIVADEPVSALDVSVQAQIINLLKDLQKQLGLTFLFIAHDLSVVQHFSDRIAVMYMGRIVEECSSLELFRKPLHPYTRLLLASIPVPDPAQKKAQQPDGKPSLTASRPASGCRFHSRCPLAVDSCRAEEPPLREISPGHSVACHLA
jgi:oligopeptide transport system ATP-binding protein